MPLAADDISALYRSHARAMVVFFARRTYDADAAVDLVAETFAAAVAERARFRGEPGEQAAAWLYGIARHKLQMFFRDGRIERRAMTRLGIERRALTEDEFERIEELAELDALRGRVAARLEAMTPDEQLALRLRVVEERSYDEVAAALRTSPQTARARVSRALRALAARLPDDATEEVGGHA